MRKIGFVSITILIMLIVTRFVVRIVDATVQIGDDMFLLILLLIIINALIVLLSRAIYKKHR